MRRDQPVVQFDDGITDGRIALGARPFGMFDAPGDDLPAVAILDDFPFNAIGPILVLLKDAPGGGDLVAIPALGIFRVIHAPFTRAADDGKAERGGERERLNKLLNVHFPQLSA